MSNPQPPSTTKKQIDERSYGQERAHPIQPPRPWLSHPILKEHWQSSDQCLVLLTDRASKNSEISSVELYECRLVCSLRRHLAMIRVGPIPKKRSAYLRMYRTLQSSCKSHRFIPIVLDNLSNIEIGFIYARLFNLSNLASESS